MEPAKKLQILDYERCIEHDNQPCIYICSKPECRKKLTYCQSCIDDLHFAHSSKVVDIEYFISQSEEKIQNILEYKGDNYKQNAFINSLTNDFNIQCDFVINSFASQINSVREKFLNYQREKKNQIMQIQKNKINQLINLFNKFNDQKNLQFKNYLNISFQFYESVEEIELTQKQIQNLHDETLQIKFKMMNNFKVLQKDITQKIDLLYQQIEKEILQKQEHFQENLEIPVGLVNQYIIEKDQLGISKTIVEDEFNQQYFKREKNKNQLSKQFHGWVMAITCSQLGNIFATGLNDNKIKIFNTINLQNIGELNGHSAEIRSIQIFKDETKLISSSNDKSLRIWDLQKFSCLRVIFAHQDIINSINLSFDDQKLISGSNDKLVKIWDMNNYMCIKQLNGHESNVQFVNFSPTNIYFLSASDDRCIIIWNSSTYKKENVIRHVHNTGWNTQLFSFSNNEQFLIVAGPASNITILNFKTLQTVKIIQNSHKSRVYSVLLSINGKNLISADLNQKIKVWSIETLSPKRQFDANGVGQICFCSSINEKQLYVGNGDQTIKIWDFEKYN